MTQPTTQPISLPVIRPQPNQAAYAITDLNLFTTFNRSSYQGEFGIQAPPFDPSHPIKNWFDTSAPSAASVSYSVVAGSNPPQIATLTMTPAQAAQVNLAGDYEYPAYSPSATTTAMDTFADVAQPINAAQLCLYADAVTLSAALNGPNAPAPSEAQPESTVAWNSELRRIWVVPVGSSGVSLDAAPLLALMWANGVGAPGKWDLTTPASPRWVPAPEPDWSALPVVESPIRPLLPNEALQAGPMGIGIEIVRTDLAAPAATTAGTCLTATQAAQLETIFNWVLKQG